LSLLPGFGVGFTLLQVARLAKVIHSAWYVSRLRLAHLLARWAASPSLTVRLVLCVGGGVFYSTPQRLEQS
jgi:hypothetical protein